MIRIKLKKNLGRFKLDAEFQSEAGITAIFGASGAGKTSLLRSIAGLERPQTGLIEVNGNILFDSTKNVDVAVHKRRTGYVFQHANLFSHLNVMRNLTYSQWAGRRNSNNAIALDQVLEMLGIQDLTKRMPYRLSGGERQRVSIARALLSDPAILLLDEPMSALDAARRNEIIPFLERIRDEMAVPIFYISHSMDEVLRLGDHLVLMQGGKVSDHGPAKEVLERSDLLKIAAGQSS